MTDNVCFGSSPHLCISVFFSVYSLSKFRVFRNYNIIVHLFTSFCLSEFDSYDFYCSIDANLMCAFIKNCMHIFSRVPVVRKKIYVNPTADLKLLLDRLGT